MKTTIAATYLGPTIYSRHPTVRFNLGGLLATHVERDLLDDLCRCLPGLGEHSAPCGAEAFFSGSSAQPPVNHVFEHVCVELQNLAGGEIGCVRTNEESSITAGEAVVAYEDADVCAEAARLAAELIASLLPADSPATRHPAETFDFERRLEEFMTFAQRKMLPVQDRALVKAARARGVPVARLMGRVIQLGHGRFQHRLSATKTTRTNVVSNDIAANKDYARRVLGGLGLPIPRYARVSRGRDAIEAARSIGYPVVVKPNKGNMGHAVSVGMKNRREVRAAFERAREHGRSVLVEELVGGFDYRLLVINGELCAASKRVPGHVRGDGVHTIEELLAEVNSDPRRGTGQKYSWTRIQFDDQAERLLSDLGYTRTTVPAEDEVVYLRRNANTSDGGTAVDVTDEVHPENREIAVRAAKAIGLDIAGVDLLAEDISRSIWKSGGSICEINSRPGLRKHMWPAEGRARDVMTPIVDMLFPEDRRGRIPIVAVTGTGSTGVAARMLAHVLESSGYHVGLVTGHHVYIDGRKTRTPRLTVAAATRMVLFDPDVDFAVLELPLDDVLQHGLGCDAVDVCAIVNDPLDRSPSQSPVARDVTNALRVVVCNTSDAVLVEDGGETVSDLPLDLSPGTELVRISERDASSFTLPQRTGYDSREIAQGAVFASVAAGQFGVTTQDIEQNLAEFRLPARKPAPQRKAVG